MKKMTFLLSMLFTMAALQAQTVLTNENHAINTGDHHHFKICNNVEPGPAGANRFWDFSDLEEASDLVSHMLNGDLATDIPETNTIIEEYGNKFCFTVEDNIVKQTGMITKRNTIIKYDEPFVKMVFPFAYGDTYEGEFSGYYSNNNQVSELGGEYKLEADGYGTLILPGNVKIENVLRLKTTRTRSFGHCSSTTAVTYRWYCDEVRYPLLSIITYQDGDESKTSRTAYYADAWRIMQKEDDKKEKNATSGVNINVKVLPNPFHEEFKINLFASETSKVKIELYNSMGSKITNVLDEQIEAGQYSKTIYPEKIGMSDGTYYLKVIAGDKVITKELMYIKR